MRKSASYIVSLNYELVVVKALDIYIYGIVLILYFFKDLNFWNIIFYLTFSLQMSQCYVYLWKIMFYVTFSFQMSECFVWLANIKYKYKNK